MEAAITIAIHKPELEALILRRMERGGFDSVEETLMQVMETAAAVEVKEQPAGAQRTGVDLIRALQSSPYRELDIEPARYRSTLRARDVKF